MPEFDTIENQFQHIGVALLFVVWVHYKKQDQRGTESVPADTTVRHWRDFGLQRLRTRSCHEGALSFKGDTLTLKISESCRKRITLTLSPAILLALRGRSILHDFHHFSMRFYRKTLHGGQSVQILPNCEAIKYQHKLFARNTKLRPCNNCDSLKVAWRGVAVKSFKHRRNTTIYSSYQTH